LNRSGSGGKMRMFYVTGDLHGDLRAFDDRDFRKIRKSDFIVVCGDFGVIWYGDKSEEKACRMLGNCKYGTLFVEGCHENFNLLKEYPVTEWNGGKVQVIHNNLIHLMRGQVYTIGQKKLFTMGGGESIDREMRTPNETWWQEEMPSPDEMEEGIRNLVANDWEVDYIITHEAPYSIKKIFDKSSEEPNGLQVYFDYINSKCNYAKWVFGCYHQNKRVSSRHEAVFEGTVRLD
jgi:hypothetical protein